MAKMCYYATICPEKKRLLQLSIVVLENKSTAVLKKYLVSTGIAILQY